MPIPRNRLRAAHILGLTLLAVALAVSLIVRIRFLGAPLERDEGESGYLAQALLAGYAPWQIAYNLKLPGADFFYAAAMALFGQTAVAIRLGLLAVNVATVFLVGLLGRRLFGRVPGLAAAAAYAILSCSRGVFGTIAHATHFVAFFAVIGTLILISRRAGIRTLFASGLIYGLAFLTKQPGIAFGAFGIFYLLWDWRVARRPAPEGLGRLGIFTLGLVLPWAVLCAALFRAGTFPRFWFWTVTLSRAYASKVALPVIPKYFALEFPYAVGQNVFLWIAAALGILLALRNPATRRAGLFLSGFLVFSFLAVSAGGNFNPNYFILMLPAVALAVAAWTANGGRLAGRRGGSARTIAIACAGLACAYSVARQRAYLFTLSPYQFERQSYGLNPFPEAVKVADFIRTHSSPDSRIAVLGSEAEIYFYSHRQAATGYLFTYGLMETHRYALPSQFEMMREIEAGRPEFLVWVGVPTSWLQKADSSKEIFGWAQSYIHENFTPVGVVDLLAEDHIEYIWGPQALTYRHVSPVFLIVYRRKK